MTGDCCSALITRVSSLVSPLSRIYLLSKQLDKIHPLSAFRYAYHGSDVGAPCGPAPFCLGRMFAAKIGTCPPTQLWVSPYRPPFHSVVRQSGRCLPDILTISDRHPAYLSPYPAGLRGHSADFNEFRTITALPLVSHVVGSVCPLPSIGIAVQLFWKLLDLFSQEHVSPLPVVASTFFSSTPTGSDWGVSLTERVVVLLAVTDTVYTVLSRA